MCAHLPLPSPPSLLCPWCPLRGPCAHLVFPSEVTWQVAERSQEKGKQEAMQPAEALPLMLTRPGLHVQEAWAGPGG